MGTKNSPGRFDCYGAAEPDEPVFVLLARDERAPAIVEAWATSRIVYDEKAREALACAKAMREWRAKNRP